MHTVFEGKTFIALKSTTSLKWGSHRGDRIGIYNYNIKEEKGFEDIDFFKYQYHKD